MLQDMCLIWVMVGYMREIEAFKKHRDYNGKAARAVSNVVASFEPGPAMLRNDNIGDRKKTHPLTKAVEP